MMQRFRGSKVIFVTRKLFNTNAPQSNLTTPMEKPPVGAGENRTRVLRCVFVCRGHAWTVSWRWTNAFGRSVWFSHRLQECWLLVLKTTLVVFKCQRKVQNDNFYHFGEGEADWKMLISRTYAYGLANLGVLGVPFVWDSFVSHPALWWLSLRVFGVDEKTDKVMPKRHRVVICVYCNCYYGEQLKVKRHSRRGNHA